MFLDSLFNGQIKPIMNAGLFYVETLANYFALMGPHYFLSAPYFFRLLFLVKMRQMPTNGGCFVPFCSILVDYSREGHLASCKIELRLICQTFSCKKNLKLQNFEIRPQI